MSHVAVYTTFRDDSLTEAGAMSLVATLGQGSQVATLPRPSDGACYGVSRGQGPDRGWYAVLRPGDGGEVTLVRALREAARVLVAPVDSRTETVRGLCRLARSVGHEAHATAHGVLVRGVLDSWEVYPSAGPALDRALGLDPESLLGPCLP